MLEAWVEDFTVKQYMYDRIEADTLRNVRKPQIA